MWASTGKDCIRRHAAQHRTRNADLSQTTAKNAEKAKANLDAKYSYLAGNALGRDSKGRIKKDDQATSTELQSTGHLGDQEYSAYVFYEFEIV